MRPPASSVRLKLPPAGCGKPGPGVPPARREGAAQFGAIGRGQVDAAAGRRHLLAVHRAAADAGLGDDARGARDIDHRTRQELEKAALRRETHRPTRQDFARRLPEAIRIDLRHPGRVEHGLAAEPDRLGVVINGFREIRAERERDRCRRERAGCPSSMMRILDAREISASGSAWISAPAPIVREGIVGGDVEERVMPLLS